MGARYEYTNKVSNLSCHLLKGILTLNIARTKVTDKGLDDVKDSLQVSVTIISICIKVSI